MTKPNEPEPEPTQPEPEEDHGHVLPQEAWDKVEARRKILIEEMEGEDG